MKSIEANTATYTMSFPENPISIVFSDDKGDIVYCRDMPQNTNVVDVNFPNSGIFYSNAEFNILAEKPLKVKGYDIELPPPERDKKIGDLKIIHDDKMMHTPACIYTNESIIVTGKIFKELPQPFRLFLLHHELGHFFYSTEWKCDLFALKYFLMMGYNESNAFYALSKILRVNDDNMERITNIFNTIKN